LSPPVGYDRSSKERLDSPPTLNIQVGVQRSELTKVILIEVVSMPLNEGNSHIKHLWRQALNKTIH
jgi:hypothetical protein